MAGSRIKDVSSLLGAFFDEDKLRQGGKYAEFFGSWKQIAGERLAAHSRVVDVDKGILIVEAEHPGWIQLLQLDQSRILETAARRFPELALRAIMFRLTKDAGSQPSEDRPKERLGPFGPEGRNIEDRDGAGDEKGGGDIHEVSAEVTDPALRKLLEGLKKTIEGKE
jgi:hypothetical protein